MPREQIRSDRSASQAGSDFFNTLEEVRRDWMTRATAEVELSLKLSKKLTDAHSVPDAVAAYQEWLNEEMGARGRRTSVDGQWAKVRGRQFSISFEQLDERQHDHVALARGYRFERSCEQW